MIQQISIPLRQEKKKKNVRTKNNKNEKYSHEKKNVPVTMNFECMDSKRPAEWLCNKFRDTIKKKIYLSVPISSHSHSKLNAKNI